MLKIHKCINIRNLEKNGSWRQSLVVDAKSLIVSLPVYTAYAATGT